METSYVSLALRRESPCLHRLPESTEIDYYYPLIKQKRGQAKED